MGEAVKPPEAAPSQAVSRAPEADEAAPDAAVGVDAYLRAATPPALGTMFLRFGLGVMSPALAVLGTLIPCAAGYVTVRLFEKRHRLVKSAWEGCGLGALTGLLCFLPSLFLQLWVLSTHGKEAVLGPLRDQAEHFPMAPEVAKMLEDPFLFTAAITFGLAFEAILLTAVSGLGGAVAAKLLRKQG